MSDSFPLITPEAIQHALVDQLRAGNIETAASFSPKMTLEQAAALASGEYVLTCDDRNWLVMRAKNAGLLEQPQAPSAPEKER